MTPLSSPKTVLLVEDNFDNREVYLAILKHHKYHVLEAHTGPEALEQTRTHKPDLVLMDISIPVIDGWTATITLKADPDTAHIPIVALTAHALTQDRQKAKDIGCTGYLSKPCEPSQVIAEVKRIIGPAFPEPDPSPNAPQPITLVLA